MEWQQTFLNNWLIDASWENKVNRQKLLKQTNKQTTYAKSSDLDWTYKKKPKRHISEGQNGGNKSISSLHCPAWVKNIVAENLQFLFSVQEGDHGRQCNGEKEPSYSWLYCQGLNCLSKAEPSKKIPRGYANQHLLSRWQLILKRKCQMLLDQHFHAAVVILDQYLPATFIPTEQTMPQTQESLFKRNSENI